MMQQAGTVMAQAADQEEPLDNELSLDPADDRWSKPLDSWEDGKEYDVSMKIRQVSPGRFEVLSLTPEGGETEEEAPEEKPAKPSKAGVTSNVRDMMESE